MRSTLFKAALFSGAAAVFALSPPGLRAEEAVSVWGSYSLSAAVEAGFLFGQSRELFYTAPDSKALLSRLDWAIEPLFYLGAALNFSPRDIMAERGFFAHCSLRFGIPGGSGTMKDRDWDEQGQGIAAGISTHGNDTQNALLLDIEGGFSFPAGSKALFKVFAAFSFMRFSWTASNGSGIYAASNWVEIPFHGPVIDYVQNWIIFSPGIAAVFPLFKRFFPEISLRISPLIYCTGRDDHLARKTRYEDTVAWGFFLEPRLDCLWVINPRLDIKFGAGYRHITGGRGDTTVTYSGGAYSLSINDRAGAGYSALDTRLMFALKF
jgi:outer membrane protease